MVDHFGLWQSDEAKPSFCSSVDGGEGIPRTKDCWNLLLSCFSMKPFWGGDMVAPPSGEHLQASEDEQNLSSHCIEKGD